MLLAHVNWFINDAAESAPFSFQESAVLIWLGIGLMLILDAAISNHFLKKREWISVEWLKRTKKIWIYIFQLTLAFSLLFAAESKVILVPHYPTEFWLFPLLQAVAALLLIVNRGVWVAALLVAITYFGAVFGYGVLGGLEYLNILGMAVFLFLVKAPSEEWRKGQDKALDLLRICTGLSLVVLAFSEKLAAPGKAMELLEHYELNFMAQLGVNFPDRLFILSAGMMELIFGLIMILGFIPRFNTLALGVFLIASNTYFFTQSYLSEGWVELLGHLPVLGTAMLLIVFGKSFKIPS